MGLPDRDYYLLDKYKPQRDAYRAYIQRTLELTETPNASAAADQVLAFETEIAKLSWPQADLRNLDKLNNPMTPAQLAAYAPGIDWASYLPATKVVSPKLIVGDNTAVKALAALYDKTPLETLKLWQRFKVTDQASDYLSKRFVDSKFAVHQVADRCNGAAPALAPRHCADRRPAGRGARPDLCPALFLAAVEGDDGRAGFQPEEGGRDPHQGQRLDGGGDQAGRARQARQDGRDGRLSRQVPRLFEAGDEGGRPLRQRQAQLGLRVGLSAERSRQAGRPQEMGDEPGDGERL